VTALNARADYPSSLPDGDIADFLAGMSRAASAVCVVTTDGPAGKSGITINSMTSVSAEPPSLLICIRKKSATAAAILQNRSFCVNMLRDDQSHVSDVFSGRLLLGSDRFVCAEWGAGLTGSPTLKGAATVFDCELAEAHCFGTHHLLIGRAVDVKSNSQTTTLIYHDRQYCKVQLPA